MDIYLLVPVNLCDSLDPPLTRIVDVPCLNLSPLIFSSGTKSSNPAECQFCHYRKQEQIWCWNWGTNQRFSMEYAAGISKRLEQCEEWGNESLRRGASFVISSYNNPFDEVQIPLALFVCLLLYILNPHTWQNQFISLSVHQQQQTLPAPHQPPPMPATMNHFSRLQTAYQSSNGNQLFSQSWGRIGTQVHGTKQVRLSNPTSFFL